MERTELISEKVHLGHYFIGEHDLHIYVCDDRNSRQFSLVREFWTDVYVGEMDYPADKSGLFPAIPVGSLLFIAEVDGTCVGTIRTCHSSTFNLEFSYSDLEPRDEVFEVSKLILSAKWRSSNLLRILMMHTQFYCNSNFPYSHIVINSALQLIPFYKRLGFFEINEEIHVHPIIGNESKLLACANSDFQRLCETYFKNLKQQIHEL